MAVTAFSPQRQVAEDGDKVEWPQAMLAVGAKGGSAYEVEASWDAVDEYVKEAGEGCAYCKGEEEC
jgi:hypothetical protein